MARQRSIFAITFPHKPLVFIASKHAQSDDLDSQLVFFRPPVIKDWTNVYAQNTPNTTTLQQRLVLLYPRVKREISTAINAFSGTFGCNLNLSNSFTSSSRFFNCVTEMNVPLSLFIMLSHRPTCLFTSVYRQPWIARDIAWRVRYLRTEGAHKQLNPVYICSLGSLKKRFSDRSEHMETTSQRSQRQRSQSSISAIVAIAAMIWKPLSSDRIAIAAIATIVAIIAIIWKPLARTSLTDAVGSTRSRQA